MADSPVLAVISFADAPNGTLSQIVGRGIVEFSSRMKVFLYEEKRLIAGYQSGTPSSSRNAVKPRALRVSTMFSLYLEGTPVLGIVQRFDRLGWRNKQWTTHDGKLYGGTPLRRPRGCFARPEIGSHRRSAAGKRRQAFRTA